MLNQVTGDLFRSAQPDPEQTKIIMHGCNDIGAWGAGFVVPLGNRYPQARIAYLAWCAGSLKSLRGIEWVEQGKGFQGGSVLMVRVAPTLWVANAITQHDVGRSVGGKPPVRLPWIKAAARRVASFANLNDATIHLPRLGAGLAGGKWPEVEQALEAGFGAQAGRATVYNLDR